MTNRATGIGSMPGEDFADSMQIVLGEVGDLPYLVELPLRGAHASMIGRTMAMITELSADLQPAGWRLTDAPGIDHRRAMSLLAQDLDTVEELTQGAHGTFKVQVAGPWTLAASVERPRGDRVLADFGARRDLAQALAEGVRDHVADVARRTGAHQVVVQVDEPGLVAVLEGAVPTASGFNRHRSVAPAAAVEALDWVISAVEEAGATAVVHCCARDVPLGVLNQSKAAGISLDLDLVARSSYDEVAAWVESGRELWLGLVPGADPADVPSAADLTRRLLSWWSALGFSDVERLPPTTVSPACGLAGATPRWARTAHELVAEVARNLSAEQGRISP